MMRISRIKNIFTCIIAAAVMCFGALLAAESDVYAADNKEYVYDYADILTADEEAKLKEKCMKASKDCQCDFVIVTTKIGHDYSQMDNYMSNMLKTEGYSYDAIIYGVDMVSRADRIYTQGKAQTDISQSKLDNIRESCEDKFSDSDFYHGFTRFIRKTDICLTTSIMKKVTYTLPVKILISAAVAIVAVAIMMHSAKAKMTVSSIEYTKDHQFKVNDRRDIFINTTVTTRHIERSSGGGGGGGGGGNDGLGGDL